jgi:hypothetical protein
MMHQRKVAKPAPGRARLVAVKAPAEVDQAREEVHLEDLEASQAKNLLAGVHPKGNLPAEDPAARVPQERVVPERALAERV